MKIKEHGETLISIWVELLHDDFEPFIDSVFMYPATDLAIDNTIQHLTKYLEYIDCCEQTRHRPPM